MHKAQICRRNSIRIADTGPRVKACYRFHPKGRVFVANSSRCVDAHVVTVNRRGIVFLADTRIAPGTPIVVEMEDDDRAPIADMAAEVLSTAKDEDGEWLHACTWVYKVPEGVLNGVLGYRTPVIQLATQQRA